MPKTRSHTPAPAGTGRRLLRALGSALVLCVLVAGLPLLLGAATVAAWPSGIDAFTHLFTRTDTFGAFLLALCAVGWIGWAGFTLSLLLEIPAQLRGRSAPRLPGLHLSQRTAATLVSGILVLFTTSTALASAAPAATASVTTSHTPGQTAQTAAELSAQTATPAAQPATADQAQRTYTVQDARPAESLWSIAEKLYGHGELYTKIADANEGHQMADGSVFHANEPIQPGWTLLLPDDPTTGLDAQLEQTAPAQSAGTESYTVHAGDTLWGIAEDELGDGAHYDEIFEENRGAPQPGGTTLSDPDEIRPGWTLDIPHASDAGQSPGRTDSDASPPSTGSDKHADEQQAPDTDDDPSSATATPAPKETAGHDAASKPDQQPGTEHEGDNERTSPSASAP
ncbi:LysM peptidoglycan-binding domain-containing protein, partial [Streptomyces sp. TRM68367]|uniref:LysM peptidoglycan-binding domain-containing protein n=1 Tax=Streptomyces sp. TRM68367 TaxID=2758415 RepID=UPI00165C69A9